MTTKQYALLVAILLTLAGEVAFIIHLGCQLGERIEANE